MTTVHNLYKGKGGIEPGYSTSRAGVLKTELKVIRQALLPLEAILCGVRQAPTQPHKKGLRHQSHRTPGEVCLAVVTSRDRHLSWVNLGKEPLSMLGLWLTL